MSSIYFPILKRACAVQNDDGYACYKLPVPVVVGIAVGSIVGVFILAVLTFFLCRLRRQRQKRKNGDVDPTLRYLGSQKGERIAFNPNAY